MTMKNPVFKAQVSALFEKLAWGQDPGAVAAIADPKTRERILRGLGLSGAISSAGESAGKVLSGAGMLAEKVLMGGSPDSLLSKGLGGVSSFIQKHPAGALGAAALTPILLRAASEDQHTEQRKLMDAYQDPSRVIQASLDDFLEKKAALRAESGGIGKSFADSASKAIATSVIGLLAHGLGSHFTNTKNILVDEPRRKRLLDTLFKSDAVIRDAIDRHPDSKAMLLEAYGTMTRFAPALSLDINATRSFLREAVMGGSGVNYATIKNLADTEKAISGSKPSYGGK